MKKILIIISLLIVGCEGMDYSTSPQMNVVRAEQNLADFYRIRLNEGYWYDKEKTLEEATKVCQDCLFEAKKATVNIYQLDRQASREVSLFRDCMKIHGYEYFLPEDIPTELKTKRIKYVGIAGKKMDSKLN